MWLIEGDSVWFWFVLWKYSVSSLFHLFDILFLLNEIKIWEKIIGVNKN